MPVQSTHAAPGHHWLSSLDAPLMELTVHSQVTLTAPAARKTPTTCRQAATNADGDAWPSPQEYQAPFISCPKDKITGCPNARTSSA
jgi:hypothetical protein